MPDLGPYALEVGLAYAGAAITIALVVTLSVSRARRVRRALEEAEARWAKHG